MTNPVTAALLKALVSLFHPRMLFMMLWPVASALLLWIVLAVAFWSQAQGWVDAQLRTAPVIEWAITIWPFALIAAHLAWVILALLFIPAVLVTAVTLIGIFAMPAMVAHVAQRHYPDLERRRGGGFAGSVWNGLVALAGLVLLALVSLPLWLLPPLWPLLPVALFAWFNQHVFRYDALAEHASAAEIRQVVSRNAGRLYLLGLVLSLASYIPIFGFFAPVFAGLAFIHFCLDRLTELRHAPLEGELVREGGATYIQST